MCKVVFTLERDGVTERESGGLSRTRNLIRQKAKAKAKVKTRMADEARVFYRSPERIVYIARAKLSFAIAGAPRRPDVDTDL